MTPSGACIDLVKQFEGCRLVAYPDPKTGGEPITIGYGHTGGIRPGTKWTQAQADAALAGDLAEFAKGVSNLLEEAPTTQGQFDALVSFGFNVGLYGAPSHPKLRESTLLRKHKAGDYAGAAAEFGKWINKGSLVEKGLRRRRAAEAKLYSS